MVTGNSNSTVGELTGPNIPVIYTLSNIFLPSQKTSPISGLNIFNSGVSQSGFVVPAFPSYARSGRLSPAPVFGVNVGSFWQALSRL